MEGEYVLLDSYPAFTDVLLQVIDMSLILPHAAYYSAILAAVQVPAAWR